MLKYLIFLYVTIFSIVSSSNQNISPSKKTKRGLENFLNPYSYQAPYLTYQVPHYNLPNQRTFLYPGYRPYSSYSRFSVGNPPHDSEKFSLDDYEQGDYESDFEDGRLDEPARFSYTRGDKEHDFEKSDDFIDNLEDSYEKYDDDPSERIKSSMEYVDNISEPPKSSYHNYAFDTSQEIQNLNRRPLNSYKVRHDLLEASKVHHLEQPRKFPEVIPSYIQNTKQNGDNYEKHQIDVNVSPKIPIPIEKNYHKPINHDIKPLSQPRDCGPHYHHHHPPTDDEFSPKPGTKSTIKIRERKISKKPENLEKILGEYEALAEQEEIIIGDIPTYHTSYDLVKDRLKTYPLEKENDQLLFSFFSSPNPIEGITKTFGQTNLLAPPSILGMPKVSSIPLSKLSNARRPMPKFGVSNNNYVNYQFPYQPQNILPANRNYLNIYKVREPYYKSYQVVETPY